ncbi:MAG: hypothetical protein Q7K35_06025 [bacterium]|nr:hypothetical protein [bacterium]
MIKIVKWFVEKIKESVEDYQAKRWYSWFCSLSLEEQNREISGLSDEEWEKEQEYLRECEEAYRQHCKEDLERMAQQEAEMLERWKRKGEWFCHKCGESPCSCHQEEK